MSGREATLSDGRVAEALGRLHAASLRYWVDEADEGNPLDEKWMKALHHAVKGADLKSTAEILFSQGTAAAMLGAGRFSHVERAIQSFFGITRVTARRSLDQLRRSAAGTANPHVLLEAIRILATAYWRRGHLDAAHHYFDVIRRAAGDDISPGIVSAIAGVELDRGNHATGLELAREALAMAAAASEPRAEMEAASWIGYALDDSGPTKECLSSYRRALRLSKKLGDDGATCITEARLGMHHWKIGDVESARPHFERALEVALRLEDPYCLGLARGDMGHYFIDKVGASQDDLARAEELYEAALKIHCEAGVRRGEGFWLGQLGRVRTRQRQFHKAENFLRLALHTHLEVGDKSAIPRHLWYLAQLRRAASDSAKGIGASVAYYQAALTGFEETQGSLEGARARADFEGMISGLPNMRKKKALADGRRYRDLIQNYLVAGASSELRI